ncbi:hypothetical protein D3C76_632050 [compost metagenome]
MCPHRLGAAADLEAFQAADGGDQEGEERCLGQAYQEVLHANVALQQRQEHGRRNIQCQGAYHRTANDAADHRDKGEQRQRNQQGQYPRHHQQFHGVEAQRADGVNFFVGLHRADLRGERAGSAAGHENGCQQHGELAQERECNQVDGENGRTEVGQHRGTEKCDYGAHQKGQQRHDGRGVQPGLLNMCHHRSEAPAMWLEGAAQQGFQNHTDETKQLHAVLPQRADGAADTLQQQQQHIALGLLDRDAVILD